MASVLDKLTDEQKYVLEQFKENIKECLDSSHTDEQLVKFLRANDFDLRATQKVFLEIYFSRILFGINNITETYKKSELIQKLEAIGNLGFAKDGTVIQYVATGRIDYYGGVLTLPSFDINKFLTYVIETDVNTLKEQSLKTGRPVTEITFVLDYEHFSLQQFLHKNVLEMALDLSKLFQDSYPEIWRYILLVNVPKYFDYLLSLFKVVFRSTLTEKFRIATPENTKDLLLKYIDEDVLPVFLGGKRVDSFGDPMCKEFITFGGQIPQKYYFQNYGIQLSLDDPEVESVTVSQRSMFNLNVKIYEPQSQLRLQARAQGGSMSLKIFYKEFGPDPKNMEMPGEFEYLDDSSENFKFKHASAEFKSHLNDCHEDITLYCPWSGIYVIRFSNANNWFTSRKLYFKYKVTSSAPRLSS